MAKKKPVQRKKNAPKQKPHPHKKVSKKTPKKKKAVAQKKDLLARIDNFFDKNSRLLFWISFGLTALFSLLLFEARISLTGDDSMYIIRAHEFVHQFKFPSFQGPLYPIVLSPFVALFGISPVALKALSFVFILVHTYFFYRSFKGKIPAFLLASVLVLMAINAYVLYFASQTYSEAFFMMLQSVFFFLFLDRFVAPQEQEFTLKKDYKSFLLLGMVIFAMAITRSIGYGAIIAVVAYFLFFKQWKPALFSVGSLLVFVLPFTALKRLIWGAGAGKSQLSSLLLKNYYNAAEGKEDFMGFIQRFIDNSNLYISKHLYMMLGFRPDDVLIPIHPTATVLTYALFIVGFFLIMRRNKALFFTGVYVAVMTGATFFIMQKNWDQGRLILPYFPLMILFLLASIYYITKLKKLKIMQFALPLAGIIVFFSTLARSTERIKTNNEILSENLKGNMLYGFSPDWVHFMQMSKWAAENTPKDAVIASRKPSISFIYGNGRKFAGIFRLITQNADTMFQRFEQQGVEYASIELKQWDEKKTPQPIYAAFQPKALTFINGSRDNAEGKSQEYFLYGLYELPAGEKNSMLTILDSLKINYSLGNQVFNDIKARAAEEETVEFTSIAPDSLLKDLVEKEVKYVIKASLRKYPHQKTQYTINSVYRFLYFTQLKYPGMFSQVHQIGGNNDEPAVLFEVSYPEPLPAFLEKKDNE